MNRPRDMLIACVVSLSIVAIADEGDEWSTHRRSATSPGGRFTLESALHYRRADGAEEVLESSVLALRETRTGKVVWSRFGWPGSIEEGYSGEPFVTDRGEGCLLVSNSRGCVVKLDDDDLLCLSPENGSVTHRIKILDHLKLLYPPEGKDSAGSGRGSSMRVLRHNTLAYGERSYFVARTWGARRLLVDLNEGNVVEQPEKDLLRAAEAEEAEYALGTLESEAERLRTVPGDECCIGLGNSYAAIMLAAQLQLHDAVPALRELEESEHVGGSGGDWQNERYRDGEINPFNRSQFSLRLRVHLALRLLGEKPRELPCNAFQCIRRGELAERVDLPSLAEAREERVGLVKRGMKPLEVLLAVGAPDYVLDPYWEYDIDAARPFTLRLRFKDGQVLDRIQRQRPARWQRKGSRWDDENK